ncbi:DUF3578 domain-containing protein [Virgibacillus flavescens]|uniref:DUF3578 domain-containing protein n=1 Tax=Virgibacillus flavescens TaxID=1611422 RepID=UPI003D3501CF
MLTDIVIKYIESIKEFKTISQQKTNWVTKVDEEYFYVETDSSRQKYSNRESNEPWQKVSLDSVKIEIERLFQQRELKREQLANQGRSTFIISLIAQIPFVNITSDNGDTYLTLKEFKTNELPTEQYSKVVELLNEIIEQKYDLKNLSKQVQGNLYRIKSRGRQDLRLLGFVDASHSRNEDLLDRYAKANEKSEFMANIIKNLPYFKVVLELLSRLSEYSRRNKQQIFPELAMLVVRNSIKDNLMKESVAKERTHNLFVYLEQVGLVDKEWNLIVEEQIRPKLLRVMNEYVSEKSTPFKANELGSFVRSDLANGFKDLSIVDTEKYLVKASVGQGNWAQVPWLAILNKKITTTTQTGFYIVYLFSEDMERLYLTLAQGVADNSKETIERIKRDIRDKVFIYPNTHTDNELDLGQSSKATGYRDSTALYIAYDKNEFPSEQKLQEDLSQMINYYEEYISKQSGQIIEEHPEMDVNETDQSIITHIHSFIESKGFYYRQDEVEFNEVKLDHFLFPDSEDLAQPKLINNDRIQSQFLYLKDAYDKHKSIVHDVTDRLIEINELLAPIQAHIGYRVRDEICFYLIYSRFLMDFDKAFDYQLHQKILPRITASETQAFEVLKDLYQYCTNHQFEEIEPENQSEIIKNSKYPKSAKKVHDMLRRGQSDGFTSFWAR